MMSEKLLMKLLGKTLSNISPSDVYSLIARVSGHHKRHRHHRHHENSRSVDPTDKRATLISVTEMGRARAYEFEDSRDERLDSMFANLNDEEKEELTRLLRKLTGIK